MGMISFVYNEVAASPGKFRLSANITIKVMEKFDKAILRIDKIRSEKELPHLTRGEALEQAMELWIAKNTKVKNGK